MATINFTGNTDAGFTATSADDNATLNRYLTSLLQFKTPPSFDPIAKLPVEDQNELEFPITLTSVLEGKFAVKGTTLDIQAGPSASIGLLQDDDEESFLSALGIEISPDSSGLVSLALQGTLTVGDTAAASGVTFGITDKAVVTLTSYYTAAKADDLGDAVSQAAKALTIPHDINDLKSLPTGAICRLDATGALKFSASFTYSFLNDPLAAVSIGSLPAFAINASASATIEGSVTHSSGHALTIARLPNGLLHLCVSLKHTDDFETSLTVSAGATAKVGSQDVLAFLLDKLNPNSAAEADAIAKQMPNAAKFKSDLKSAIDTTLSASLAASLKASLDNSKTQNTVLLYEIDLTALDATSSAALQRALLGDFTGLDGGLKGVTLRTSALTVTKNETRTIALHLLGIYNSASINQFIAKSKVDLTTDTREIVLSDESIQVVDNNLNAEKLRKLVLKDITLTLPLSAKADAATATIAFLDREASTKPGKMRQFVNVLMALGAAEAGAAQALLNSGKQDYGVCSLFLGLSLTTEQCGRLFQCEWVSYIDALCSAQKTILAGDMDSAFRMKLFNANGAAWQKLREAGTRQNITPILKVLGMRDEEASLSVTDTMTAVWWAEAMAGYAQALAKGSSLEDAGKRLVKDADLGYNEPWLLLAAWNLAGKPAVHVEFISPFPAQAMGAR